MSKQQEKLEQQSENIEKESDGLATELEMAKKEAAENLAGWQRAQADLINYKKRQLEMMDEFRKYAVSDMISQLLPIVDNFNLALSHQPKEFEKNEWIKGVMHIKTQLEKFLSDNGVVKIDAVGKEFNPEFHESISQEKSDKENIVIKELGAGYCLNGKVLRPARVIVGCK